MRAEAAIVRAVARHPSLWMEAVRAAAAMATQRWWARAPFLPAPHRPYLLWRMATAHGVDTGVVDSAEVCDYLRWRKLQRRA